MYDFAFPGAETDDSSGMIGFLFQTAFFQFFISESAFVRERLIELDDKVIFEVLGYSATVTGGIADDFIFFRNFLPLAKILLTSRMTPIKKRQITSRMIPGIRVGISRNFYLFIFIFFIFSQLSLPKSLRNSLGL